MLVIAPVIHLIRMGRIDRTIFHEKQQRNNERKKERKKSQPNAKQKTAVRNSTAIFWARSDRTTDAENMTHKSFLVLN